MGRRSSTFVDEDERLVLTVAISILGVVALGAFVLILCDPMLFRHNDDDDDALYRQPSSVLQQVQQHHKKLEQPLAHQQQERQDTKQQPSLLPLHPEQHQQLLPPPPVSSSPSPSPLPATPLPRLQHRLQPPLTPPPPHALQPPPSRLGLPKTQPQQHELQSQRPQIKDDQYSEGRAQVLTPDQPLIHMAKPKHVLAPPAEDLYSPESRSREDSRRSFSWQHSLKSHERSEFSGPSRSSQQSASSSSSSSSSLSLRSGSLHSKQSYIRSLAGQSKESERMVSIQQPNQTALVGDDASASSSLPKQEQQRNLHQTDDPVEAVPPDIASLQAGMGNNRSFQEMASTNNQALSNNRAQSIHECTGTVNNFTGAEDDPLSPISGLAPEEKFSSAALLQETPPSQPRPPMNQITQVMPLKTLIPRYSYKVERQRFIILNALILVITACVVSVVVVQLYL